MRWGLNPVTETPLSTTLPRSGTNSPEIRLKTLVLPAPFGPINACSVRSRTTMLASTTALMPPNAFAKSFAARTTSPPRCSGCRNAGSDTPCSIARAAIAAASTTFGLIGSVNRCQTPTSPVGENTTKATNRRPKYSSQFGVQIDKYSSAGPSKLRMPPMITIASISPENAMAVGSADAKR